MATQWISPTWRMPKNSNQSKVDNYSLDFAGSAKIEYATPVDLGVVSTFSFWMNIDAGTTGVLFGNSVIGANEYVVYYAGSTFYLRISGAYQNFPNAATAINTGQWHHVAFVRSSENEVKCYIDSVLTDTITSWNGTPGSNPIKFDVIGSRPGGTLPFSGKITEIAGFNYALSASQVTELYGTGSAIGNPMAITNGRKPVYYAPLGNAAFNGEFLASNGAEQDYVFNFDASDYISTAHISISGAFTASAWVNTTDTSTYANIFSSDEAPISGSIRNWQFIRWNNKVRLILRNSSGSSILDINGGTINDGIWHNIVVSWDGTTGTNGAKIYVDNVLEAQGTASSTALRNDTASMIMGGSSATWDLIGKLSNVSIFDIELPATGAESVESLYNYGTPPNIASYSGLQGFWELDASATFDGSNWTVPDASSNSNTGTSSGMTAANLVQSDLIINAPYDSFSLQMDGADEYIDCGASSFSGETGISVSAWVYPTAVGTAQAEAIISTDVASTAPRGFYLALYASNKIRWQIGTTVYNSKNSLDVTNTLQLNQWNHLVGTWNATTMSVYINGSLAGDEPSGVANGTFNSTNNILIGARETTGGYFPGRISNAAIFKSTLSAAQVLELYNENKPFDLNNFSVTANNWWRLGSVNTFYNSTTTEFTVLDEVGTNNGTSVNMEQGDLVSGVGATGSGTSSGMSSGTNKTGDAPYSSNNAVSYNMSVTAKSTSVPT